MTEYEISFEINGVDSSSTVAANRLLRDFIRDDLGLTGTKGACDDGMCGSCSIHFDGKVVKSCLVLAVEADRRRLVTIEGLAPEDGLHPVQQALIDNFGFQCGFCTPGFAMTMAALLEDSTDVDPDSARESLVGNICRCTGYTRIVASFLDAARSVAAGPPDRQATQGDAA